MGLADVVSSVIATAKRVTQDLQPTVWHLAWVGQDELGKDKYAEAVEYGAIVEDLVEMRQDITTGSVVATRHRVAFLEPVPDTAPLRDHARQQPIDPRDQIVLPDGTTGPIVSIEGLVDRRTDRPFFSQVWLGTRR